MNASFFPFIFLMPWLLFWPLALAQSSTQAGANIVSPKPSTPVLNVTLTVLEKGTGRPVKRAEVRVEREVFYTDPDGRVSIPIPQQGKGKILVSRFRFENLFVEYDLVRQQPNLEVFLFPGTPGDNEVYVRGEKRPETSKKTITVKESARIAPGGDPAQITQLLPGVQTQTLGSDIAVRGSGPSDSVYWVDNFQIPQIFHFIGGISVLPEQMLSDVEFYAGGFSPRYGDATGGVVRLLTKTEMPEVASTEVRINLPMYSALYHEKPLSEESWLGLSLRYSYLQYILPYFLQQAGGDMVVVPYFGDAHALYVKKSEDGGHQKLFVMGSQDGLQLVAPFGESDRDDGRSSLDLYNGYVTVGLEMLKPLGSGWSAVTAPQVMYNRNDNQFFSKDKLVWDLYTGKAFFELSKRLSKDETLYIGYMPEYGQMNADITGPIFSDDPLFDYEDAPRETLSKKVPYWVQDAWASVDQSIGRLTLTPGFRYRFDGQIKKGQLDPRLLWRLRFNDQHILKGAYGLYSKSPEPQESAETFGNPDLEFVKSTHYVLGLESRWSDRWETDVQLYYKTTYDKVASDPEKNFESTGSARSKGAEIFVRRNLTERMFGWVSYTYSVTEERDTDQESWRSSDYDQTHIATLASSYRLTATWDLGLRYTYRTGNTYTPINDAVYNANLDKYQPRERSEDRNSTRLPPNTQTDLWLTKDFLYDTWKMALRVGVQYLSFSEQVYSRSYNYDYTEEEDFTSLPPIPYIELRGKF